MRTFILGFSGGVSGTIFTLVSIAVFINVRYFLLSSHFCPQCGHTKHRLEVVDSWSDIAKCCQCNAKFWPSSDDYRRHSPRTNGDKEISMKLFKDWQECMKVIFLWKIKKLKERFLAALNLKISEK